jgi:gamma-glutamylcyclotransferase (GGCT)/AIG2-like uncharacterized protein YtfP
VAIELIFVYGTLMRGYALHPTLARVGTYVGSGRVRGTLLDLGSFPGLVEGTGSVSGEVYRIHAPERLPEVDREEEGYNFERRRRKIALANGRPAWAWVYYYRGARERAPVIAHGDYRHARPPQRPGRARGPGPRPRAR